MESPKELTLHLRWDLISLDLADAALLSRSTWFYLLPLGYESALRFVADQFYVDGVYNRSFSVQPLNYSGTREFVAARR